MGDTRRPNMQVRRGAGMSSVSIFEHISAHLPEGGPGLTEGGDYLPDEPGPEEKPVRLVPGLHDHIVDPGSALSAEQTAASVLRVFVETAYRSAPAESFGRLYQRLIDVEEIGFLEPFVRRVYESRLRKRDVRDVAVRLVTGSTDRLPVKTGIALLGICARREDQQLLLTMARHGEFTDYAAMAITNAFGEQEQILWELAKVVEGWGRVALVEQLASTKDPEIKAWMFRQANEDYVLLANAAPALARSGGLRAELEAEEIDEELIRAAGAILQTLIEDRPYETKESIDDYGDAPQAIKLYLAHLSRRLERLESIHPLLTIIDYLELRGGVDWNIYPEFREKTVARVAGRPLAGWNDEDRARTATFARWVLQRPGWRRAIGEGLRSDDNHTFYLAQRAAQRLGDDVFPVLLDRLRRDPFEGDISWDDAARAADEEGFDQLLDVALSRLIEHRPYESWIFPHWLHSILKGFERFPGKGWPLIREGLTSPVMMERRFGIGGLRSFADLPWPSEALGMLVEVMRSDPDEYNRDDAAEVLEEHGFPGRVGTP
jgi:hypothetical protein